MTVYRPQIEQNRVDKHLNNFFARFKMEVDA